MLWSNKALILSSFLFFYHGVTYAEKIECPQSLTENNKKYALYNLDVFEGPPKEMGSLMPDSDDSAVWTLSDSRLRLKLATLLCFSFVSLKAQIRRLR
jgi:hypothetical protein